MKIRDRFSNSRARDVTDVGWRSDDGVFISHDGDPWLYRVMPQIPLAWEDSPVQRQVAHTWHGLLCEIGETGRVARIPGTKHGGYQREIHILTLKWDHLAEIPKKLPLPQKAWVEDVLGRFQVSSSLLVIGVKLKKSIFAGSSWQSILNTIRETRRYVGGDMPDERLWQHDKRRIAGILHRAQGRAPTATEAERMEFWWNGGRSSPSVVIANPDGRSLSCDSWPYGLEFSALIGADTTQFSPDNGLWLMDALIHRAGCVALSIRGNMYTSEDARALFRKSQRKAEYRIEEEAATGDLDRPENEELFQSGAKMERQHIGAGEPLMRHSSIIFARQATEVDDSFIDALRKHWSMDVKVLEFRQHEALRETLPCGVGRLGNRPPFSQDYTMGMLAESGLAAFSKLGDDFTMLDENPDVASYPGIWMGLALYDMTPVWLNTSGASQLDKSPAMAVVGEPGSGKTFFLQMLATQAALAGRPVMFINPKPADSLGVFAERIGGKIVRIAATGGDRGLLDPYKYALPSDAAQIAKTHIRTALVELSEEDEVSIGAGLARASMQTNPPRNVTEALEMGGISEKIRELVEQQVLDEPLFALGVAEKSDIDIDNSRWGDIKNMEENTMKAGGNLTLVEFDRAIPIPYGDSSNYDRNERCALAAIRLLFRISFEQMQASENEMQQNKTKGGLIIIDEAHVIMSSVEGRHLIQLAGRTGRSQGILPVLATQRLSDLIGPGADLASYLSRILLLRMTDPKEVAAALELIGFKNTEARKKFLAQAAPDRGVRDFSQGLFQDLHGRRCAINIGPIPDEIAEIFSTNPIDRDAREKKEKEEMIS